MAFEREARRSASLRTTATDNLASVGKQTLVAGLSAQASESQVQRREVADHGAQVGTQAVQAAAARGVATPSAPLPHRATIQQLFGRHDISGVQAHTGADAAASARAMGAEAYATGNHVVLGGGADLHTVAHEAAHVVQQRAGVHLKGGVGEANDAYERHADQVADLVVRGQSAESVLAQVAGPTGSPGGAAASVQRKISFDGGKTIEPFIPPAIEEQALEHGFETWQLLTQWHREGEVHTKYTNWDAVLTNAIARATAEDGRDNGGQDTKGKGGEQRNTTTTTTTTTTSTNDSSNRDRDINNNHNNKEEDKGSEVGAQSAPEHPISWLLDTMAGVIGVLSKAKGKGSTSAPASCAPWRRRLSDALDALKDANISPKTGQRVHVEKLGDSDEHRQIKEQIYNAQTAIAGILQQISLSELEDDEELFQALATVGFLEYFLDYVRSPVCNQEAAGKLRKRLEDISFTKPSQKKK
jgi:hypothetical protein